MAKTSENLSLFPILPSGRPFVGLTGIARMAERSEVVDNGHRVEFRSLPIRTILNRSTSRRNWGFARTINPYRGCEFGCHYCYARYTHEFMELRGPKAFEQQIFVKQNAAWMLRQELRSLRPDEAIAIGTATDPYQPIERNAKVTRSILEVLADQQGLRLGLVTKSTLVVRDIDLLQRIAKRNRITINMTITTLDTRLARILEPRAPRPDLRLAALQRLRDAGLRAGVLCCPLMPGITDSYAAVDRVAAGASKADASFFHAEPLFLKPCSKTVFEEFVAHNFPELSTAYGERYRDRAFVGPAYRKRMVEMVGAVKAKYGWGRRSGEEIPRLGPATHFGQMNMQYSPGPTPAADHPARSKLRNG
jgi:DNA repair photolyase